VTIHVNDARLNDEALHKLTAEILLRAVKDTGVCPAWHKGCGRECARHKTEREREYCDVQGFWDSPWAEVLCTEMGLEMQVVADKMRQKGVAREASDG